MNSLEQEWHWAERMVRVRTASPDKRLVWSSWRSAELYAGDTGKHRARVKFSGEAPGLNAGVGHMLTRKIARSNKYDTKYITK